MNSSHVVKTCEGFLLEQDWNYLDEGKRRKRWTIELEQNKDYFEKCEDILEFGRNILNWAFSIPVIRSRNKKE